MSHPAYQKTVSQELHDQYDKYVALGATNETVHEGFGTNVIHAGQDCEPIHGSVNVPIHMSTTFKQRKPAQPYSKFDYTRCGNPTTEALNECLSACEYGTYTHTFASGCGATTAILSQVKNGEHIVVCDDVYGGTNRLIDKVLGPQFGILYDFVDMSDLDKVKAAIKPNTRMIWIETPTNPTLKLIDVEAICNIAKEHKLIAVSDNTFASPFL